MKVQKDLFGNDLFAGVGNLEHYDQGCQKSLEIFTENKNQENKLDGIMVRDLGEDTREWKRDDRNICQHAHSMGGGRRSALTSHLVTSNN